MKRILALIMALSLLTTFVFTIGVSATSENSFPDGAMPVKVGVGSFDSVNDAKNALDGNLNTYLRFVGPQAGTDKASEIHISFKGAWETVSGIRIYTKDANESVKKVKLRLLTSDSMTSLEVEDVAVTDNGKGYFDIPLSIGGQRYNVKAQAIRISPVELTGSDWSIAEVKWLAKDGSLDTKALDGSIIEKGKGTASSGNTGNTGSVASTVSENSFPDGAMPVKVGVGSFDSVNDAKNALDGNLNTYLRFVGPQAGTDKASEIHISFKGAWETISGIRIYNANANESVKKIKLRLLTSDSMTSLEVEDVAVTDNGKGYFDIPLKIDGKNYNVKAQAIRISPVELTGSDWSIAEVKWLAKDGSLDTKALDGSIIESGKDVPKESVTTPSENTVSFDNYEKIHTEKTWKISASSERLPIKNAFDGNYKNFWHSNYTNEGSTITGKDQAPFFITVEFPETIEISGWCYTPRSDTSSGTVQEYIIHGSVDGKAFTKLYEGTFNFSTNASENKEQKAAWDSKELKAVKIEIKKGIGGYGTAAEIEFLKKSGATKEKEKEESSSIAEAGKEGYIDRTSWKLSVNSEVQKDMIKNIIDGKTGSYWHSSYKAENGVIVSRDSVPFIIDVDFGKTEIISGLKMIPRQDSTTGTFTKINIYASESESGELVLIRENVEFNKDTGDKDVLFASNIRARRIRVEVVAAFNYGTLAELYVIGENKEFTTLPYDEFRENENKNALIKIPNTEITASYSVTDYETYKVGALTDGNIKTVWQGIPDRSGDVPVVSFDLGGVKKIKEITYTPFNHKEFFGCWLKVNIWASKDGADFESVKENVAMEKGTTATSFRFDEPVEARFFEFEIMDYHDARPSGAEVEFFQRQTDALSGVTTEKYVLKIGSNDIKYGEGETATIDVAPFIVNGTTLIPLRGLLELMGAEILWNGEIQEITVKNKDYEIKLMVDYRDVYVTTEALGKIRYTLREVPIIKDSRTFIPVRFVSEQLGYNVAWNGETQEITITK